jgi:hypothetical protein
MFYYAFLSWRAKPEVPEHSQPLSYAVASGYTQLLPFVAFILTVETTGVHLIVHRWSHIAAWIITSLSIYAVIWVTAFWRSLHLRPILISGDTLTFRLGYLFEAQIPRAQIASWQSPAGEAKGAFRNARLADPQFLIELTAPVTMQGPYGIRKNVSKLALAVDNPVQLKRWLMLA